MHHVRQVIIPVLLGAIVRDTVSPDSMAVLALGHGGGVGVSVGAGLVRGRPRLFLTDLQ